MTVSAARAAMLQLDLPYLQQVRQTAQGANAYLIGLALATIAEDGQVTREEALELAALIYLLGEVERQGNALARVTGMAATSVIPLAHQTGTQQGAQMVREVFPDVRIGTPFQSTAALIAANAFRTQMLGGFGSDAVAIFVDRLGQALESLGLRSAVVQAIEQTFGAADDTQGQMVRRAMVVVRQSNYDTYREAMVEMYRFNVSDAWWEWVARKDGRTCAACLALSGRVFPVSRAFEHNHVGCRCVPRLLSAKESASQSGEDWLKEQDEATQRQVLGVRGAELFRGGAVELRDFLRLHPASDLWAELPQWRCWVGRAESGTASGLIYCRYANARANRHRTARSNLAPHHRQAPSAPGDDA